MYGNRKSYLVLSILVMLMVILSFKSITMRQKFIAIKNNGVIRPTKMRGVSNVEKYGYSDILECLRKNSDFQVGSISKIENEKCSVDVIYKGEIKSLYNSLYSLNESKNFLGINSISVNRDSKITKINIYFKKNK